MMAAVARARRTPRLDPEVRRRQILDATMRVAEGQGFGKLTIDAVAREAGITRPVVYDLFGDMDGLLAATLADAEGRALAGIAGALPVLAGGGSPDAVLSGAMRQFLEAVRADPATWRLILLAPQSAPPALRARVDTNRAALADRIAEVADWWATSVGAGDGVDRRMLARIVIAVCEDMARLVLEHPRKYTPTRVARAVEQVVRLTGAAGATA